MITHPNSSCSLDTIETGEVQLIRHWRNRPEIFKWCRQNDLIDENNHHDWYGRISKDPKIKMFLIRDYDQKPVGVCGLTDLDLVNQRAEFSLYIAPAYQAKGHGESALRLLLWHGFNAYPLNQIWGEVFDGNPAMGMFEKVGFKRDAVRREFYFRSGEFIDAHLISIKRNEFTWNS